MDDLIFSQFAPLISDAFKEAFLSQLSYTDIIELLDMQGAVDSSYLEAEETAESNNLASDG